MPLPPPPIKKTQKQDRRTCGGETPYKTLLGAVKAANRFEKINGLKLEFYICQFCKNYHLLKTGISAP